MTRHHRMALVAAFSLPLAALACKAPSAGKSAPPPAASSFSADAGAADAENGASKAAAAASAARVEESVAALEDAASLFASDAGTRACSEVAARVGNRQGELILRARASDSPEIARAIVDDPKAAARATHALETIATMKMRCAKDPAFRALATDPTDAKDAN